MKFYIINDSSLITNAIVMAQLTIILSPQNKLKYIWFFEKTLLLIDINMDFLFYVRKIT